MFFPFRITHRKKTQYVLFGIWMGKLVYSFIIHICMYMLNNTIQLYICMYFMFAKLHQLYIILFSDFWSRRGCFRMEEESNETHTTCFCDHLTHFAVLFDFGGTPVSYFLYNCFLQIPLSLPSLCDSVCHSVGTCTKFQLYTSHN